MLSSGMITPPFFIFPGNFTHSKIIPITGELGLFGKRGATKGANAFCFLSSLPLLPLATTAVIGSYTCHVISLLITNPVSWVRACLSIRLERFRGTQKEVFKKYLYPRWVPPSLSAHLTPPSPNYATKYVN